MPLTRSDIVAKLGLFGAATVGESGARTMHERIRAVWRGARLVAPAFTVQCTGGDNLALHVAVTKAPAGSVLVANVEELRNYGYWGEVLTTAAEARAIAGLVIDGGVRDSEALEGHGFPVFSSGVCLRGAAKVARGSVGKRVWVGEIEVETGDWVVGDADGVSVVVSEDVEQVLEAAQARYDKEERLFEELKAGRTTVQLLNLDPSPIEGG